MGEVNEPFSTSKSNYPEMSFGKSYLFYGVTVDKLVIFTKLPGLEIPKQMKDSKFGVYDSAPNKKLRDDHYLIETSNYSFSDIWSPAVLSVFKTENDIAFTISWYGNLEYIGEI